MHRTFDGGMPLLLYGVHYCAMKISGIRNKHTALAVSCLAKKKKKSKVHLFPLVSQQKIGEVIQPEPPRPCTLHRAIRRGIKLYLYYLQ